MNGFPVSPDRKTTLDLWVSEPTAGNNVAIKRALFENENTAGRVHNKIPERPAAEQQGKVAGYKFTSVVSPQPAGTGEKSTDVSRSYKPSLAPKPQRKGPPVPLKPQRNGPPVPRKPAPVADRPEVARKPVVANKPPVSFSDQSDYLIQQYTQDQNCTLTESFRLLIGKVQYNTLIDCIKKGGEVTEAENALEKDIFDFLKNQLEIKYTSKSAGDINRVKSGEKKDISLFMMNYYKQKQKEYKLPLLPKVRGHVYLRKKIRELCAFDGENKEKYLSMIYDFVDKEITEANPANCIEDLSSDVIDEYFVKWKDQCAINGQLLKEAFKYAEMKAESNARAVMKVFFENKKTDLTSYVEKIIGCKCCLALFEIADEKMLMGFMCENITNNYIVSDASKEGYGFFNGLAEADEDMVNFFIREFYKKKQEVYNLPLLIHSEMEKYFICKIKSFAPKIDDEMMTLVCKYMQVQFEKKYSNVGINYVTSEKIDEFFIKFNKDICVGDTNAFLLEKAVASEIDNMLERIKSRLLENDALHREAARLLGEEKYKNLFEASGAENDQDMNERLRQHIISEIRSDLVSKLHKDPGLALMSLGVYENVTYKDCINSCIISYCRLNKSKCKELSDFIGDVFLKKLIEKSFHFECDAESCVNVIYEALIAECREEHGLLGGQFISFGNEQSIISFFNRRIKARAHSNCHEINDYLRRDGGSSVKKMNIAVATDLFTNYEYKTEYSIAETVQEVKKPEYLYRVGNYGNSEGDEKNKVVKHKLCENAFDFVSVNHYGAAYGWGLYTTDSHDGAIKYYRLNECSLQQALMSIKLKDDCSVRYMMDSNIVKKEDIMLFKGNKCHIPGTVYRYAHDEKTFYYLIKEPQSIASVNAYCVSNIQYTKIHISFSAEQIKKYQLQPKKVSSERMQELMYKEEYLVLHVDGYATKIAVYKFQAKPPGDETKYYIFTVDGYIRVKPVVTQNVEPINSHTKFPEHVAVQYYNPNRKKAAVLRTGRG